MRRGEVRLINLDSTIGVEMQSINLVSTNPCVRNGRPCIAGTTIEVATIAIAKVLGGQEPEEIAADLELSLSQVYAALAYYYDHKKEIDATVQQRRQLALSMKEVRVGSRHQPLFR